LIQAAGFQMDDQRQLQLAGGARRHNSPNLLDLELLAAKLDGTRFKTKLERNATHLGSCRGRRSAGVEDRHGRASGGFGLRSGLLLRVREERAGRWCGMRRGSGSSFIGLWGRGGGG
jgi:hypothetical protein